mgnify:CR=1 FL=1
MLGKALLSASVSAPPAVYVEDVFSTYLYTGNGSTQTITNGIDLSGKGGLVWIKGRSGVTGHRFTDTTRGATKSLESNSTAAEATESTGLTAFNADGFALGADADYSTNAATYASWTFRKAPKFFDVVTYTGNGSNRSVAHNLDSVPGTIIIKRTDSAENWVVWHRSLGTSDFLSLNSTSAKETNTFVFNTLPTSSLFYIGANGLVNQTGGTYVAYVFAHDAGGFGDAGTDSVVKCGSYTGSSGTVTVDLGWEPQFLITKKAAGSAGEWRINDSMRGFVVGGTDARLDANSSAAESTAYTGDLTPTGFMLNGSQNDEGGTYIYIAIRRGPMKTPTDATKVFGLNARTGTGANATVTGGQVDDAVLIKNRGSAVGDLFAARLTSTGYLVTSSTAAEVAAGATILQANPWDVMDGVKVGTTSTITNASGSTFINYLFRRAPGFFDVVAYTGTGANRTVSHNLGVVPELMIVKARGTAGYDWLVYHPAIGNTKYIQLNFGATANTQIAAWDSTTPTSSVFSLGNWESNANAVTYIAYLFATCPGVSKVGSYTGTGTTLNIDCGFTAGARFVLIKRTDSTGDWYAWDTARGIVSGNDPYLLLNSTAAEVTSTDYIDPLSSGFQISSTAPAAINASGGAFIFLAIA